MVRFKINHGFRLRSTNKLLMPRTLHPTENQAEIAELREKYVPCGACEEVKFEEKKATEAKVADVVVDPSEDLGDVDGITKTRLEKLAAIGITKKSELAAALAIPEKAEELKPIFDKSFNKVLDQLVPAVKE
jgi:predicted flap endonuclease-1-like 5' DNA nuclease